MKCQNKLYLTGISSSAYKAERRIEMEIEEIIGQIEYGFYKIEEERFQERDEILAKQMVLRERVRKAHSNT